MTNFQLLLRAIGAVSVTGLAVLPSCNCDDPSEENITTIHFLLKNGMQDVFDIDSVRKSLIITKVATGEKVDSKFEYYATVDTEHSTFTITDTGHDSR